MNFREKLKETLLSVIPIMAIVLLLAITVAPFSLNLILRFITGGFMLIIGLTLFLIGIDIGILPIGERIGAALTSKKNLKILLSISFLIGLMITIAEPDVQVLASQIGNLSPTVNKWHLVFMIALGIGFFLTIGLCKTVLSLNLRNIIIISYIALFSLAFFCPEFLQGAAFDAGGATTGPMTVPFILALGMGVSSVRANNKKNNSSNEGSFGLTGIASIGPIAAVCLYGILLNKFGTQNNNLASSLSESSHHLIEGMGIYAIVFPTILSDVFKSLLPLVIMFILFQIFLLKMPPVQLRKMFNGILYCFIGLVLFLLGADCGFMQAGQKLGESLGLLSATKGGIWTVFIIIIALIFGAITVCAEPAVWVLTEQVEEASGRSIKRKIMLTSLSFGVAISIGISILKIIYGFNIWFVLIPGYALALALTFFCPPLFTGIAFDSGGVASGPMTSTFILSFTIGCSSSYSFNTASSFGVIALVAMTPLIAIQILGIIYKINTKEAAS